MVVYVETLEDWKTFVRGQWVMMSKKPLKNYYRAIIISPIEIVSDDDNHAIVEKKY